LGFFFLSVPRGGEMGEDEQNKRGKRTVKSRPSRKDL
jgi:hypothetical protein